MPESLTKSGLSSTASTTGSSMTLMHSSRLSGSKPPHDNTAEREQNPHCGHYNGQNPHCGHYNGLRLSLRVECPTRTSRRLPRAFYANRQLKVEPRRRIPFRSERATRVAAQVPDITAADV